MPSYTIHQLATLAGVSVRTLHFYDEKGLLKPQRRKRNGYRVYGENDLLTLQQILFFRELDFPLNEIKRILASPGFDMRKALTDQRHLIELKKKRLSKLLKTIQKTLQKINHETPMQDQELYHDFDMTEINQYAEEAKQRWGHTEAWRQSQDRTRGWTKDDYARLKKDADIWMKKFAAHMHHGFTSEIVQQLIAEHYNSLRTFYEPNFELYRGLAEMYVADERFRAYYEKYAAGLAAFMRNAMIYYCDMAESG